MTGFAVFKWTNKTFAEYVNLGISVLFILCWQVYDLYKQKISYFFSVLRKMNYFADIYYEDDALQYYSCTIPMAQK